MNRFYLPKKLYDQNTFKVIEGVGGGNKQKFRWIDWLRLPPDWPRDGTVLEERSLTDSNKI